MYVVIGLIGAFVGFMFSSICGVGAYSDLISKLQYLRSSLCSIDADTHKDADVALCSIHKTAVDALKLLEE